MWTEPGQDEVTLDAQGQTCNFRERKCVLLFNLFQHFAVSDSSERKNSPIGFFTDCNIVRCFLFEPHKYEAITKQFVWNARQIVRLLSATLQCSSHFSNRLEAREIHWKADSENNNNHDDWKSNDILHVHQRPIFVLQLVWTTQPNVMLCVHMNQRRLQPVVRFQEEPVVTGLTTKQKPKLNFCPSCKVLFYLFLFFFTGFSSPHLQTLHRFLWARTIPVKLIAL